MKVPKAKASLVKTSASRLFSQQYRGAQAAARQAFRRLQNLLNLSPESEPAILVELLLTYFSGLTDGVADSDPNEAEKVRKAMQLLEGQRRNAAKGAAARRNHGDKTRETIRKLDDKYREKVSKKGVRVQKIASELGISPRTVERHLKATS